MQCGEHRVARFSSADDKGRFTGIDVDMCRAVAAAIFGDAEKVKYNPLTAKERFTALQSGEIDMLPRNTTWTYTRDTSLGLNFTGVNFYDGQGFLVTKNLGVKRALEMDGASFCIQGRHDHRVEPRRLFPQQQDELHADHVRYVGSDDQGIRGRSLRCADIRPVAAVLRCASS